MSQYIYLVPLFPLIGFLILGLLNRSLPATLATVIGSGAVLASFVVSVLIFLNLGKEPYTYKVFDWIGTSSLHINFSFLVDQLSALFLLIITGIGFLIHLYSAGYMSHDDGVRRFFAYLNLFIFFMLLLVLGDNYVMMFVGWEGVGLCSYLLIGFWFKNIDYAAAAKKAFVMNRIGDLGFLLGIFLLFTTFEAVDYASIFSKADKFNNTPVITAITLLLFVGAMGKSAQLPLYTWLPDAMAGPTPVSALIHAATMVTAGIYMIARSSAIFVLAPFTMDFITWIGLGTAMLAATIGFYQTDIKKVLAYSTVSQLGLMFVGLGVGAFSAGVFHVLTHAFFKALLFLCAGSVIHAMSNEQDIRSMGGLRSKLPITHLTFLMGYLAIIGFPFFSGFYSKDQILIAAFEHNKIIGILSMIVALMTAFYMSRLYFLTFWGKFRGTHEQEHHLHESPITMTLPLMILAILSVGGGYFGGWLGTIKFAAFGEAHHIDAHIEHLIAWGITAVVLVIAAVAYVLYVQKGTLPAESENEMGSVKRLIFNKYRIDELYESLITKPLNYLSDILYSFFDKSVFDNAVNNFGFGTQVISNRIRTIQSGNVDLYFFGMVLSIILILLIKMI